VRVGTAATEIHPNCVHIDTSTSPSTRILVPRNTSLDVFQWRPFIMYKYGLPVNERRTVVRGGG